MQLNLITRSEIIKEQKEPTLNESKDLIDMEHAYLIETQRYWSDSAEWQANTCLCHLSYRSLR